MSRRLVARVQPDGSLRWGYRSKSSAHRKNGGIAWDDGGASARDAARHVYGAWAKIAREPTPRGLKAFSELVPRDHETHLRWKQAEFHRQWQDAAFLHKRLNVLAPIEHGKTEQLTIVRTAWEIGCDPGLRHLIVQNTASMAVKTARAIRSLIEDSPDYRRVFPAVRPYHQTHPAALWTDAAFTVQRPNSNDRNPTLQATGLYGSVLGARVDRAKLDDVETLETTRSPEMRRKTLEWIRTTVFSRVTRRGRIINAETSWHPDDLAHTFMRQGWPTIVHSCRKKDGSFLWDRYDEAWEAEKKRELGPIAAARMLYNRVRADEEARFREEWLIKALHNGLGEGFYPTAQTPPGFRIVIGVDLAVGRGEDHDLTAFATVLAHPNGDMQLLHLESGRWSGPDIVGRIIDHSRRYPGALIIVENNGAQDYIAQFAAQHVAQLIPYTTGRQKADPRFGIESLATEIYNGKWSFPCSKVSASAPMVVEAHPEIEALLDEMFDYTPSNHTGDRLMALWLAREGVLRGSQILQNIRV